MPEEEFRAGAHDLETPFLFVPHGAPDPVEFKRKYPGWVSFPATFVPHPRPVPKWKIMNGQRWPLDKKGRPWPKTRYGRPTSPFDELPPGIPAPGTQYELMRKLENPTLFWEGEPTPTVAEVLAIGERSRAERAAAAPPPPITPPRAYDGDGMNPARDYLNAMRVVDQQLREFAASARQEMAAAARQHADAIQAGMDQARADGTGGGVQVAQMALPAAGLLSPAATSPNTAPPTIGQVQLDRAGRRLGYIVDELINGELSGAAAHLLRGKPYPPGVDDLPLGTLAPLPGFTPSVLPDQADPGFGTDPDAGKPTVLVTPAAPQAGPNIEVFDPPSVGPTVFDNRTIEQFRNKLDKQFGNLKPVDFDAARQEMGGKIVAEKGGGQPYDHVQKISNAMTGVINIIGELTRRLSHPDLSDTDRQAATELLSQASRKVEEARRRVPGIDQRLGDYK